MLKAAEDRFRVATFVPEVASMRSQGLTNRRGTRKYVRAAGKGLQRDETEAFLGTWVNDERCLIVDRRESILARPQELHATG